MKCWADLYASEMNPLLRGDDYVLGACGRIAATGVGLCPLHHTVIVGPGAAEAPAA